MAFNTTVGADEILSEILSATAIPPTLPKLVFWRHCNQQNIDGMASEDLKVNVRSNLGQAVAGPGEGVAITIDTALSNGTPITFTPAENAVERSIITEDVLQLRFPGASIDAVLSAIESEDYARVAQLLGWHAEDLALKMLRKFEADHLALFSTATNATTATAGLTGLDVLAAYFAIVDRENDHEDIALFLTEKGINDLRTEMGFTSGGLAGSVWMQEGDVSYFNTRPDADQTGSRGSFLGLPMFAVSSTLVTTGAGDDLVGLACRGTGDVRTGQVGAVGMCQGHSMRWRVQKDIDTRAVKIVGTMKYDVVTQDQNKLQALEYDS